MEEDGRDAERNGGRDTPEAPVLPLRRSIRYTSRSAGDLRQGDRDAATVPGWRSRTASTPLPTFPAAWTLSDPRGRPYFVFWTSPHDDTLTRVLRMESVQQRAAVQLTIPDVGVFQIPIVRRPLPRRGGFSMLYRCPGCGQPKRHLYLRSLVIGRLVDYQGPLCQACAGLRWASQGRPRGAPSHVGTSVSA